MLQFLQITTKLHKLQDFHQHFHGVLLVRPALSSIGSVTALDPTRRTWTRRVGPGPDASDLDPTHRTWTRRFGPGPDTSDLVNQGMLDEVSKEREDGERR